MALLEVGEISSGRAAKILGISRIKMMERFIISIILIREIPKILAALPILIYPTSNKAIKYPYFAFCKAFSLILLEISILSKYSS